MCYAIRERQAWRAKRFLRWLQFFVLCGIAAIFVSALPPPVPSAKAGDDFPPAHWLRASGAPAGSRYVGRQVCAECHVDIAATQSNTSMGKASISATESQFLAQHPILTYNDGGYVLRIERREDQEIYSASDGQHTISVPILWAFGLGDAGQTYVFQRGGNFYESRISYYKEIDGLELTIGHKREPPPTLSDALGRQLSKQETAKCFPCHTSEGVVHGELQTSQAQVGVTCENCHGPGSQHLEAIQKRQWRNLHIFNPGRLSTDDLNDFCGTCHRSTRDVLEANIRDIRNVRFQPYRLENSACYDPSDKRISCLACHNPHENLVTEPASYDAKCLACHRNHGEKPTAVRRSPACPKAVKNCVSCHMLKLDLPGAHYRFTDHDIRVARPGDPYPDSPYASTRHRRHTKNAGTIQE